MEQEKKEINSSDLIYNYKDYIERKSFNNEELNNSHIKDKKEETLKETTPYVIFEDSYNNQDLINENNKINNNEPINNKLTYNNELNQRVEPIELNNNINDKVKNTVDSKKINKDINVKNKSEEFVSPKKSMLHYLWTKFSKNKINWIFLSLHLLFNLLILIVPIIIFNVLDFASLSKNGAEIIYDKELFLQTFQGVFLSTIVVNCVFIILYGIYLGSSVFGSSKNDGIELLLVSRPITRRDIASMRIVFGLIIAISYALIFLIWTPITYSISFIGFDNLVDQANNLIEKVNNANKNLNIQKIELNDFTFLTKFSMCYGVNGVIVIFGTFFACFLGISFGFYLSGLVANSLNKSSTISVLYSTMIVLLACSIITSCTQTFLISPVNVTNKKDNNLKVSSELNDKFKEWFITSYPTVDVLTYKSEQEYISIKTEEVIEQIINDQGKKDIFFKFESGQNYIENNEGVKKYINLFEISIAPQSSIFEITTDNNDNNGGNFFQKYGVILLYDKYKESNHIDENNLNENEKNDIKKYFKEQLAEWLKRFIYPATYWYRLDGYLFKTSVKQIVYKMFYEEQNNEIQNIWNQIFNNISPITTVDYLLPTSSILYTQGLGHSKLNMNHSTKMYLLPKEYIKNLGLNSILYNNNDSKNFINDNCKIIYSSFGMPKLNKILDIYNNFVEKYKNTSSMEEKNNLMIKTGNKAYQEFYSISSSETYDPFWGHIILNLVFIPLMAYFLWFMYQRKDFS